MIKLVCFTPARFARTSSVDPTCILTAFLLAYLPLAAQASPLQTAEITTIINDVRVAKSQAQPSPAKLGEIVRPNESVLTGPKSRTELIFSDQTLARLGANTQFTFIPGSRQTELNQGTMLLQVPKGAGGAQIKTAAVTAAVTGTTIMIEYFPNSFIKIIVLEGTLRVSLTDRLGESLLLESGKMLILSPNAKSLPDPVDVDLKKLVKTSQLIAGMGGLNLDLNLIDQEIAAQETLKRQGRLIDTNILIAGSGTELVVVDPQTLQAIENAISANQFNLNNSSQNGPNLNPSFATITSPNPFPLGPDSIVSTNPTITNGPNIYNGASRMASGNPDDTAFVFDSLNTAQDVFLGGYPLTPGTPFAAFRFANLTILGNPIILTPTGVVSLALVSEGFLSLVPGSYTFSPLTSLFLGSVDSLTVPFGVNFNNPTLDLILYARGPGASLTFEGSATTSFLRLQAAGDLIYSKNAVFNGTGLDLRAIGNITIAGSATASTFIDIQSGGIISFDPDILAPLTAPLIFIEQGPGAGILHLNPNALHATNFLHATADGIFIENFLPFSLRLNAGSAGINVAIVEGEPLPIFNLNTVNISGGGSLTAGLISFNHIGLATISGDVSISEFLRGDVPVSMTIGGSLSAHSLNFSGLSEQPDGGSLTLSIPEIHFGSAVISFSFDGAFGLEAGGHGGQFTLLANSVTFHPNETFYTLNGGNASFPGLGGNGGTLVFNVGQNITFLPSVQSIEASGASNGSDLISGGHGGLLLFHSNNGVISIHDFIFLALGGDADSEGGNGGTVEFITHSSAPVALTGTGFLAEVNGGAAENIAGNGGTITLHAPQSKVVLDSAVLRAHGGPSFDEEGISGSGGDITISALDVISVTGSELLADGGSTSGFSAIPGDGGNIGLTVSSPSHGQITIDNSTLRTNAGDGYMTSGTPGSITLATLRQAGTGINVTNSSVLRSLATHAASSGGFISLTTAGADITVENSSIQVSGAPGEAEILALIPESAPGGTIHLTNANMSAEILRIGALGPDGSIIISNGSILSASNTLKIYGGTASGLVHFTGGGTITLAGGGEAFIRGHTVRIDLGTTVDNDGMAATTVQATQHQYNITGFGNFTTMPEQDTVPDFFGQPGL